MSNKTFLKLKPSVNYNVLKAKLQKTDPDLKVIGGDGSVQHIHKDLLRCVSSKFYHALEYSKEKGHDPECLGAIKMPGLDEYGLKCLYDLLYKGFHLTDPSRADDVIARLNNLDIPLANQEKNGSIDVETNDDDGHPVGKNSSRNDAQRKHQHQSNVHNDGRNDIPNDAHNNVNSDNYSPKPPSSTDSTDSSWSNRLRIRKRKIFTSSSADESDPSPTPITVKPNPTKTPNPSKTTTTATPTTQTSSTSIKLTESQATFATPISASRRSSKLMSPSNDDNDEPNAISQEDRDIQRITSVIKSFLPHPACFLVEDGNLECFVCGEIFRYRDNWRRHLLEQHFHLTFLCPSCGQKFKRRGKCSEHMLKCR